MKLRIIIFCLLAVSLSAFSQSRYDLVIVGGTPGGIMCAVAAAKQGKSSVILERSAYIGGLPANGLGATDIATRGATTGLFKDFVDRVKQYYVTRYGENSVQVSDCSEGYHFEPSVAARIFDQMIGEQSPRITVLTLRQFDSAPDNIKKNGDNIAEICVTNRNTGEKERYAAPVFIDATYEGDLGAAAGAPFRVGRESRDEYGEIGAGKVYRYWMASLGTKTLNNGYEGYESSGTTFQGDNAVQAYNYRLCLTRNPENRMDVKRPEQYNRSEYLSLIDDIWSGRHTGVEMIQVTQEMMDKNRKLMAKGDTSGIPGNRWGIAKITNMVKLPNGKTDANNQHLAFLSTDLPEENWAWPTAGWEWRDRFAERLKDYTLGLLWFVQNEKELPATFRNACREWGLAKDEYPDNGSFPRQVYVREGRRFVGQYFFTANDALPVAIGQRPPLHPNSVTASHYALDSHAVLKRESGRVHLDGFLSYPTAPYTVPYGVIVPRKVDNLLIPVPVSGSHIGFSTLRMEPCWMALGEAAGIAASLMIDRNEKNKDVPVELIQNKLVSDKATLIYYRDVQPEDTDFPMVQYFGLKGYLPEWEARLDDPADAETLQEWKCLSGVDLKTEKQTRGDALRTIYRIIKPLN